MTVRPPRSATRCAHKGVAISDAVLANLAAYLQQIGREESAVPVIAGTGTGLTGRYDNNTSLSGMAQLTRVENINFDWSSRSPSNGLNRGTYRF